MLCSPNYGNSIINIISSIRRFYRFAYLYPTIEKLDAALDKNYSNVVLVFIDGMGSDILRKNVKNGDFLKTHKVSDITSVFPSGGVPALCSILSGVAPNEHGNLGRLLFFKEFGVTYDMYTKKMWKTDIPVNIGAEKTLAFEDIFADFSLSGKNRPTRRTDTFVLSDDILHTSTTQILCKTFDDICRKLSDISRSAADTFSLVYWTGTANTIRSGGTASEELYRELSGVSYNLQNLCKSLKDTLVIITSTGGFIDSETVDLMDYPAICDCFYMNPILESRAASFFIKPDRLENFTYNFSEAFGKDFLLYPKSEAVRLFGAYRPHFKTDDFIGDFIAAATGRISLRYGSKHRPAKAFTGGITEEEMLIPLIICSTEKAVEYEALI
ncbi:MAG: alkaline phosphatase family protein [Ruminococcus sp.]|jgi:hypothetical protein|nr:alkaline phosphatase family protein [Ruminococcus sp.]